MTPPGLSEAAFFVRAVRAMCPDIGAAAPTIAPGLFQAARNTSVVHSPISSRATVSKPCAA